MLLYRKIENSRVVEEREASIDEWVSSLREHDEKAYEVVRKHDLEALRNSLAGYSFDSKVLHDAQCVAGKNATPLFDLVRDDESLERLVGQLEEASLCPACKAVAPLEVLREVLQKRKSGSAYFIQEHISRHLKFSAMRHVNIYFIIAGKLRSFIVSVDEEGLLGAYKWSGEYWTREGKLLYIHVEEMEKILALATVTIPVEFLKGILDEKTLYGLGQVELLVAVDRRSSLAPQELSSRYFLVAKELVLLMRKKRSLRPLPVFLEAYVFVDGSDRAWWISHYLEDGESSPIGVVYPDGKPALIFGAFPHKGSDWHIDLIWLYLHFSSDEFIASLAQAI